MLRCAVTGLALVLSSAALAGDAGTTAGSDETRKADKFVNGTDADRDAMLQDVVNRITGSGYRDLSVVPFFVLAGKNPKGEDVLLLVDPVNLTAIELQTQNDEKAETEIPGLRQ
jgi:hypothetical protein